MKPRLKPLDQQVVLITGASSGIGLVTARTAAARGAKVVLVARDGEALSRIVEEIRESGGQAVLASADVGDLVEVQRAAAKAVETFGRIDTWVNNAGVAIYAKLVDTEMADHERLFRTNYFGTVHGCLTAVEHLQREGGALVTIASIVADIPSPLMGAYAASKHAVKGYVGSLRSEIIADGLPISVTLIKPGGIATPIAERAGAETEHEPVLPVPTYDPALVAEAILDAAVRRRREMTVGGAGLLQTLTVEHFPRLLDALGGRLMATLTDPSRPAHTRDNLDAPLGDGRERAARQSGRRISLHAPVSRNPWLATGALAAVGGALWLAASRRSRA